MSNVQALAEALIYLDGQGDAVPIDAEARAAIVIAQLAERGYVVRAPDASLLLDRSAANLLAARRRLGLRVEDIAREAGGSSNAVYRAENPARRPYPRSTEAIAAALVRLREGST